METLSFMLGVSAVLITMGVVVMFNMHRKIKTLSTNFSYMEENQREIYRHIDKLRDKWYAEFQTNGKNNYVGRYDTIEEAIAALHKEREIKHKEFTRHK